MEVGAQVCSYYYQITSCHYYLKIYIKQITDLGLVNSLSNLSLKDLQNISTKF